MNNFEFWTDWGNGLSDKNFADAFLALGILVARSAPTPPAGSKIVEFPNDTLFQEFIGNELGRAVHDKISQDGLPALTPWKFPQPGILTNLGQYRVDPSLLDPRLLAVIWQAVADKIPAGNMSQRLRLQVTDFPKEGMIKPWFRVLFDAAPLDTAAHLFIQTTQRDLHIKWPLRLGFLPGNTAEPIVIGTSQVWPSNENSVALKIGRENDNCDVLVYDGDLSSLQNALEKMPVPLKCNLFIIRGNEGNWSPELRMQMMSVAQMSHCNGFVFLDSRMMDKDFHESLVNFVENFCHNYPVDGALAATYIRYPVANADPLIFLSKPLANLRLKNLVEKTIKVLKELPPGTKIQIPPGALDRMNIKGFGYIEPEKAENIFEALTEHKSEIRYDAESTGATGLSELNRAIRRAEVPKMEEKKLMQRFIQAQAFLLRKDRFEPDKRAFVVGIPSLVRVRIGPPESGWESMPKAFPVEKLPQQKEAWRLTVVLGEPSHIKDPILKEILLPKDGPSTECDFNFTPQDKTDFEGRITVLHRGRVIQTAVLKMPVVETLKQLPRRDNLELAEQIQVRANIGDLDERRQFDMAFVTNHTTDQRPHLTAIAADHAWLLNLEACAEIASEINQALSEVALSVEDYRKGLDSKEGKELLKKLALYGRDLYDTIVEAGLKGAYNKEEFARKEYLQIVSTRSDAVIPFEFIYDHEAPDDDATLCTFWRRSLDEGKCPVNCKADGRKTICPIGFWGLSKVIERHDLTPEFSVNNPDYILQSEATTNRSEMDFSGTGLVAASQNVTREDLDKLIRVFTDAVGAGPVIANDWSHWETLVGQYKPHLIVALPHSDGEGTLATLEINQNTLKSVQIRDSHVRTKDEGNYPIVALLGCDTTGTAMRYGSFVQKFRLRGAGVVIGTIATVFGGHAATVAGMLVKGLAGESQNYERLGEIMRSVKRKAMLDGLLMSLCVVAFGDADWKLKK